MHPVALSRARLPRDPGPLAQGREHRGQGCQPMRTESVQLLWIQTRQIVVEGVDHHRERLALLELRSLAVQRQAPSPLRADHALGQQPGLPDPRLSRQHDAPRRPVAQRIHAPLQTRHLSVATDQATQLTAHLPPPRRRLRASATRVVPARRRPVTPRTCRRGAPHLDVRSPRRHRKRRAGERRAPAPEPGFGVLSDTSAGGFGGR